MLDANARYIDNGEKFFVEIHGLLESSKLLNKCFKVDDVVMCERTSGDTDNYKFRLYLNSSLKDYISMSVDMQDEENFDYESFFVFAGLPSGECFIDNKVKQKALNWLGGEWYE